MRRWHGRSRRWLPALVVGLAVVGCRGGVKSGAQGTGPSRADAPPDEWTLRWGAHDRIAAKSVEHLLALRGLKPASGLGGSMLSKHGYGFTGDEARRARDIFTHDAIWPELAPGVEHVVDLGVHTTRTPELRDVSVETAIAWLHAHHPPAVEILRDPRVVARGSNPRIRRLHVADRTYVEADGRRRPACDLDVVSEADDGRVRREVTAQAVPAGDGWAVELVRSGGSWAAR
ncbi:MAG: hypothetical protein U1E39_02675 [Planctomycetota bacterium]